MAVPGLRRAGVQTARKIGNRISPMIAQLKGKRSKSPVKQQTAHSNADAPSFVLDTWQDRPDFPKAPLSPRVARPMLTFGVTECADSANPVALADVSALMEDVDMHLRWDAALKDCELLDLSKEELHSLVGRGVPSKYRQALWKQLLVRKGVQDGDVDRLQGPLPEAAVSAVAMDVNRTQPWLDEAQRLVLERVLRAFATRSPAVGYCQGMNFIVADLLGAGFDEDLALACLAYFVEDVCKDYHGPDLRGYLRDARVLTELARRFLPEKHQAMQQLGVSLELVALDHFLSLTSRVWPLGSAVRLWDIIFLEGTSAVFASFLSLLDLYWPLPDVTQPDWCATDAMHAFKIASKSGATDDLDRILERTGFFLNLVPTELLEELRLHE